MHLFFKYSKTSKADCPFSCDTGWLFAQARRRRCGLANSPLTPDGDGRFAVFRLTRRCAADHISSRMQRARSRGCAPPWQTSIPATACCASDSLEVPQVSGRSVVGGRCSGTGGVSAEAASTALELAQRQLPMNCRPVGLSAATATPLAPSVGVERGLELAVGQTVRQRPANA
jgi:hypothetical protein